MSDFDTQSSLVELFLVEQQLNTYKRFGNLREKQNKKTSFVDTKKTTKTIELQ